MNRAITYILIAATFLNTAPLVFAESGVLITNEVYTSASTGGNSADGGTIEEGTSKAKIFIKTIVNGEVVEYINETIETSGGEEAKIEKETHYETKSTAGESEEIAQNTDAQTEEVEKSNSEIAGEEPSFVATIFQKLINYVISIFKR